MRLGIDASNIRSGGGLTHLLEILSAANPQECGITRVVVWCGQQTLEELPSRHWLECRHEPMLDQSLPVRMYWQKVKLPRLAERECDCLFVPGGSYSGSFRPYVAISANMLPFEASERQRYGVSWMRLKLRMLSLVQAASFRKADGVIFLTEYARDAVTQTVAIDGWNPIIPLGINKRFYLAPRVQKPIGAYSPDDPFRLLYVSKVVPYKHQWQIVEAVAQLRSEGFPLVLDLIGGAEDQPSWRRLVKSMGNADAGAEYIHYLGQVPYSDLSRFYHRADGFVFASSCENLPSILLEAMASGLPIACSNFGPMPEVLGPAGIYFNPDYMEDITKALRLLMEDQALREDSANLAYEHALLYSWERCARETFSYLAQVTHKARVSLELYEQVCQTTR